MSPHWICCHLFTLTRLLFLPVTTSLSSDNISHYPRAHCHLRQEYFTQYKPTISMAEFADFGGSAAPASTDDPAADFLAREQSALGDLDEDFAFNKDTQANPNTEVNGDSHADFGEPTNGDVNNDLSNGISDLSLNGNKNDSGISMPILPTEEPESIKKWREEHKRALEEKDADEKTKIAELKEQGKKELEDWYTRYKDQLAKAKQQNRESAMNAEKEWIAERDTDSGAQDWEKITRLCDFNPKTSRNTKDTSRMRSILLQVKQTPPATSAPVS